MKSEPFTASAPTGEVASTAAGRMDGRCRRRRRAVAVCCALPAPLLSRRLLAHLVVGSSLPSSGVADEVPPLEPRPCCGPTDGQAQTQAGRGPPNGPGPLWKPACPGETRRSRARSFFLFGFGCRRRFMDATVPRECQRLLARGLRRGQDGVPGVGRALPRHPLFEGTPRPVPWWLAGRYFTKAWQLAPPARLAWRQIERKNRIFFGTFLRFRCQSCLYRRGSAGRKG